MKKEFKNWLIEEYGMQESAANARTSNISTIEKYYGDIDSLIVAGKIDALLSSLSYSTEDERNHRAPAHNIPINGNIRTGSATLKQALKRYTEFVQATSEIHRSKMTHQERIDFCRSRNNIVPDATIVKWLERNLLANKIKLFLSGDPTDFKFPNDYVHLYQPGVVITIPLEEDDLYLGGGVLFNYSNLTEEDEEEIAHVLDDDDWKSIDSETLSESEDVNLQKIREKVILREIDKLCYDFGDWFNIRRGYVDFQISLPGEVEQFIPVYRERIISVFEEKYPDLILRISFYPGFGIDLENSFKFVFTYIFFEIDEEATKQQRILKEEFGIRSWYDEIEEYSDNYFATPRQNIRNHGRMVDKDFYGADEETNEYLEWVINDFACSPLYSDGFTSSELIEFVEDSMCRIVSTEVHSYVPKNALSEALEILLDDNFYMFDGGFDVRFIIFVGPDFKDKKKLVLSARKVIIDKLRENFDNYIEFKVVVAEDENLSGSGDLLLYAFN